VECRLPGEARFEKDGTKKAAGRIRSSQYIDSIVPLLYYTYMTNQSPEGGFNRRRPSQDPWVAKQLEKFGLSPDASLEEVEPKAMELWKDVHNRLSVTELVLGRRVDARELQQNPDLGEVIMTEDASVAFGGLLLLQTLEEIHRERSEQ
jgi:hypothetical protein